MNPKTFLMLLAVIFIWSSSPTLLKLGLEETSPINLAFLRFLLVLPVFTVFAFFRDKNVFDRSILRNWKTFLILGLTGVTLHHVLQNLGLQFTTASNSSLIISSNPVFIALLSHFYLKKRLSLKQALGLSLAFFGVVLIIGPSRLTFNPIGVIGDLLSLGSALCWAFYSVFSMNILPSYGSYRVTMFSLIFGTLFLFPFLIVFEKPALPTSVWLWSLLFILSLLGSGVAYLLWYKALEETPATKAGVFLFFVPVISVSIAQIVLFENLDTLFAIGALLIMLGVITTERS